MGLGLIFLEEFEESCELVSCGVTDNFLVDTMFCGLEERDLMFGGEGDNFLDRRVTDTAFRDINNSLDREGIERVRNDFQIGE